MTLDLFAPRPLDEALHSSCIWWVSRCFLFVFVTLPLVGCEKSLTGDECNRLLDRYTDKVIDQSRPSTSKAERIELYQAARQKAQLDPEFAKCSKRVSRKNFDCAMQAHNADQIERCLM